ncbi:predicted protein [Histoplasma capsulatum var. duboisii H88]|uniref:Predicted protein n=1 Tax=Ajellomyces capsulatus (strain H88) TaxID=544711 RepID=F0U9B6_AJEC8|nr:predicted protein [Histoplasma capsulatum var. duboisii H88]
MSSVVPIAPSFNPRRRVNVKFQAYKRLYPLGYTWHWLLAWFGWWRQKTGHPISGEHSVLERQEMDFATFFDWAVASFFPRQGRTMFWLQAKIGELSGLSGQSGVSANSAASF